MNESDKILITGSSGMVGSALLKYLKKNNYNNLLTPSHKELNLINENEVKNYLIKNMPDFIFAAAAKVGGIESNMKNSTAFLLENITMQNNLISQAHLCDVNNLLFYGSSCIYPKYAKQPINENELLNGYLEETNEAYALAKICGLKLCNYYKNEYSRNYFSLMPTNLYGNNDNYDENSSHVIPSIIRKIHNAKIHNKTTIPLFGTGRALREFLYVDDLAEASIIAMQKNHEYSLINVGSGKEIKILNLAKLISKTIGYELNFKFDKVVPDGTPRKFLNSSRMRSLGWNPKISLDEGLLMAYTSYFKNL